MNLDKELAAVQSEQAARAKYKPPTDRHFEPTGYIQQRYKQRDTDPQALGDGIKACEEMISIAPEVAKAFKEIYKHYRGTKGPATHKGYKQLITIRKKQKNPREASRLAKEFKRVWK